MPASALISAIFRQIVGAVCSAITFCVAAAAWANAQPSVLVTPQYSNLSVVDLSLQNLAKSIPGARSTRTVVVDPNNPRLAYVSAVGYLSCLTLPLGVKSIGSSPSMPLVFWPSPPTENIYFSATT